MAEFDLTIDRLFPAPVDRVFALWAEAGHRKHWWAPKGFRCAEFTHDFRVGGAWQARLESLETSQSLWMGGAYREIETNVRIAFDFAWLEAGTDPGARSLITVTFEAEADSTRQRFHQASFAAELNRDQHHEGWSECLDRLAQLFEPG